MTGAVIVLSLLWLVVPAAGLLGADMVAIVKRDRVNVRGQPSIFSEVITQLRHGEPVTILEEVKRDKPKAGEPAEWVKIKMPANTPVWLNATFLDPASKTVKSKRLNLRAGPGENYSVVGVLPKDTAVKEIRVVDDWMEIETPETAYGFVATEFLDKKADPTVAPPALEPAPPPAPTPTPAVKETAVSAPPPKAEPVPAPLVEEPALAPAEKSVAPTPPAPQPAPVPAPAPKAAEKALVIGPEPKAVEAPPPPVTVQETTLPMTEPPGMTIKRIVRREGILKSTVSIQAPTYFELENTENGKVMNYLHPTVPEQKLKPLKGRKVIVTGEELVDPRWPKTPVIDLETIELAP